MNHTKSISTCPDTPDKLAVSIKTAANLMEVSEHSVRRLIKRGLLKPNRMLRVIRIPVQQIRSLLGIAD